MTGRLLIFVIASGLFIGTLPACTILESSLGDILDPADPNDPNDPNADPNDPNAPDPNVPADDGTDTDGDALSDVREAEEGTDVDDVDSDNDGLSDGEEVLTLHFDPLSTDSDNDGFTDGREVPSGFQPSLDVILGRVDTPLCDEFLSIAAAHGASGNVVVQRSGSASFVSWSPGQDVVFDASASEVRNLKLNRTVAAERVGTLDAIAMLEIRNGATLFAQLRNGDAFEVDSRDQTELFQWDEDADEIGVVESDSGGGVILVNIDRCTTIRADRAN